ncbi:MAG TPA: NfeD family protein [Vicinamibacteria bacterium]|nr:NfeD family protein [Vicinamibacteria bacterium]
MSDPLITVVALLVAGYLLVALELFVIPGFGVTGILGLVCLAAGCFYAFHFFGSAFGTLAVVLVLGSTTAVMLWIPKSRFGKDVVLLSSLSKAHSAETELETGRTGVAESDLRPAGIARFGELRRGVVTEGEFIEAGSSIIVTEVRGSRIVVELAARSSEERPRPA